MYTKHTTIALLATAAFADVRLNLNQKGLKKGYENRYPSTFAYQGIINQKKNNNDQYKRSNCDNEGNKRNVRTEAPQDMLPCRQDAKGKLMKFQKGVPIPIPLRWNNAHDSDCEVNLFINGMTQVVPAKRPFNCGGGYGEQRHFFTIPNNFRGCTTPEENCVVQIYGHSVEPRTYAMCIDFVITSSAAEAYNSEVPAGFTPSASTTGNPFMKRKAPNGEDLQNAVPQPAIHYADSFDTSHIDAQYSGYRGQQKEFIREQLAAAIALQSHVGAGGLVPLGNLDKNKANNMRNQVQNKIKQLEEAARKKNKEAQNALNAAAAKSKTPRKCFEGEIYGVVDNPNCNRQYTNTYVTNVDYVSIYEEFLPKFKAAGLLPYSPTLKTTVGITQVDPFGAYKGSRGEPSLAPKGSPAPYGLTQLKPPAKGQHIVNPFPLGPMKPIAPLFPPIKDDFKTGPKEQGGAGAGGNPGQDCPKNGEAGTRGSIVGTAPVVTDPPVEVKPDPEGPEPINPDDIESAKNTGNYKCKPKA
jgi:hypothetical protein